MNVKRATIAILIILSAGAITGMKLVMQQRVVNLSGKQTLYDSLGGRL